MILMVPANSGCSMFDPKNYSNSEYLWMKIKGYWGAGFFHQLWSASLQACLPTKDVGHRVFYRDICTLNTLLQVFGIDVLLVLCGKQQLEFGSLRWVMYLNVFLCLLNEPWYPVMGCTGVAQSSLGRLRLVIRKNAFTVRVSNSGTGFLGRCLMPWACQRHLVNALNNML